ncbi:hypothetical protein O0I10_004878 [Lichtheimia ornata]|uniref:Heterokaryon incompatibility domain-containing protein n=1 Tax=Lichtheimia ornata TaxID=688661 RepID=A0AAD7Y094_9FUNG|nr:uncharacterized protein O0I10_004878 [Lichtheimia ornata]KAJ8659513.1 hypothetical protein O0I10_004878 [Lichtheimia ornata]
MTITSTSKEPPPDTECGKLWTLEDTFIHPEFRLLYVPPKDEDGIMTIITPSKHEPSYVPDRKFYALSHLWGTDPKDNLWDVSNFISDEDGTTVEPIPMREEKRETFLNLLQENPGYWWIDILCCRTDTPPIIMRGVYGCCHTCFAMLDCPSDAIEFFSVVLPPFKIENEQSFLNYTEEMSSPRPISQLMPYPIQKLKEAWEYATIIWTCRWFSRVWTLQELALPSSVLLLSETCDMPCDSNTIEIEALKFQMFLISEHHMLDMDTDEYDKSAGYLYDHLFVMRLSVKEIYEFNKNIQLQQLKSLDYLLDLLAKSERSCYFAEDYVYGILGILGWDIPRLNDMEDVWSRFLFSLKGFAEKVLWPAIEEYFQYADRAPLYIQDHPNFEPDPEISLKHCRETMHINISREARSCSLYTACSMTDVYPGLLYIKADCPCVNCYFALECVKATVVYCRVIHNGFNKDECDE